MFRKMPLILIILIVMIVLLDRYISMEVKSIIYAISLSIKELIVFVLPLVIFGLLFKVAATLAGHATRFIILLLLAVYCSNYLTTFVSQFVGLFVYQFDMLLIKPQDMHGLLPYWQFSLPKLIANDKAMLLGLALGVITGWLNTTLAEKISHSFEIVISKVFGVLTILIPFFVAGFIVKLQADGIITILVKDYALIFAVIAIAQFSYIMLIYYVANKFNVSQMVQSIKNMLPATIVGFSTMSSAAAMPLTVVGTEKNLTNPKLASSVIPATVNIHLIGDCFAIPIFAYAILKNYGMVEPTFLVYLTFAFYFVLAKFSVAAVPGGGILVMLPILESHLGFNSEMLSLITALYVLFDPVITSANVMGNGGFAMLLNRLKRLFCQMSG